MRQKSEFTGSTAEYIGYSILMALGTICSCGIAFPWLQCWYLRWLYRNSVIDGKQLQFDGNGTELFGKYIIWYILCAVTCGIYGLWVPVNMQRWETEHIHFADGSVAGSTPLPANDIPNQMQGNIPAGGQGAYSNAASASQISSDQYTQPRPQIPQWPDQMDGYTVQKTPAKPVGQKNVQMYIVLGGRQMTQNMVIQGSLIVGRDQSSNLYFPDNQMSRQHFVLTVEQDNLFICDLGTTNGTFLNNRRITDKSRVMPGDKIFAGQTQFILRW